MKECSRTCTMESADAWWLEFPSGSLSMDALLPRALSAVPDCDVCAGRPPRTTSSGMDPDMPPLLPRLPAVRRNAAAAAPLLCGKARDRAEEKGRK